MQPTDWLVCPKTVRQVKSLDRLFEDFVDPPDPFFREMVLHLIRMGGKRIRPSLYFLAASFGTRYEKELALPATALELLHVASLYHDDIMDEAEKRRMAESANKKWGNSSATYAGTYLFSKAISLFSLCSPSVNSLVAPYIAELCLGQLHEAENAYNVELTREVHLSIIGKKTASLFELPCLLGASLSAAGPEVIFCLKDYGKYLGLAFQIMDDILDIKGYPEKTGKMTGTDLREGVYGLAAIYSLGNDRYSGPLRELLLMEQPRPHDIDEAIRLIEASGAIEQAVNEAVSYSQKAIACLDSFENSKAKESLVNLAKFVLHREN